MALYPALPLFTDAYLADTRHLTTEEHGAYLLLLMCAWRSTGCELIGDDKTLARIAGLSPTRWRRLKPALEQFFDTGTGVWRQKKLQAVYRDVASRVARNKANGSRGGRARAAKAADKPDKTREPGKKDVEVSVKLSSEAQATDQATTQATAQATPQATKAKTKSKSKDKQPPAAVLQNIGEEKCRSKEPPIELDLWRTEIASACGDGTLLDDTVIHLWHAAGVDLALDAVPTIAAISARELKRTGQVPHSLGYYREAVLEAAANRGKAEKAGARQKAQPATPQAQKKLFDPTCAAHWRTLLGDPGNRFRGDYMARNWFVPADHPVFRERGLGANPRLGFTSHIPQAVCDEYGAAWLWL